MHNNLNEIRDLIYSYDSRTFKDNVKERLDKVLRMYLNNITTASEKVSYDNRAKKEILKDEK